MTNTKFNYVKAASERLSKIELIDFKFSDDGLSVVIRAPYGFKLKARLEKHEVKSSYAWHFSYDNRLPEGSGSWVFDLRKQIHYALNGYDYKNEFTAQGIGPIEVSPAVPA